MSEVNIVVNLTKDPELRNTKKDGSGVPVANLRVAENKQVWDRNKQAFVDGPTLYHDVVLWRDLAENVAPLLKQGDRVMIQGRMFPDEWVDDNGNKRVTHKINADECGPSLRWHRIDENGQIVRSMPSKEAKPGEGVVRVEVPSMADWCGEEARKFDALVETGVMSKNQATKAKAKLVDAYMAQFGDATGVGASLTEAVAEETQEASEEEEETPPF